ncbi:hypothetical protein HDU86_003943 [Geranomyces michiganensis]|nr:hypothetical protein HDU86_003943 [Geranomyces michiganensis]
MKLYSTTLLALSAAAVVNATICVQTDSRFNGNTGTLVQERFQVGNTTDQFSISGTAQVVDGCSFKITNFRFSPYAPNVVWYGRRGANAASGIRVWGSAGSNTTTVQASDGTDSPSYALEYDVAGQSASWDDIDTLVLFSLDDNITLATVQIPALILNATSTTAATSASTTWSSTTSTTAADKTTMLPIAPNAATTSTTSTQTTSSARPTTTNANGAATNVQATSAARSVMDLGSLALAGLAAVCVAAVGI